jgi:hypothetical protein
MPQEFVFRMTDLPWWSAELVWHSRLGQKNFSKAFPTLFLPVGGNAFAA